MVEFVPMGEIVITWRELIIAVVLATVIYLLETLLFNRRRAGDKPTPTPSVSSDEVSNLREELTVLRRRLDAMEKILARPQPGDMDQDDTPYARAVRLARDGLPPPEVASRCGISRGEAELIVSLHGGGH